MSLEDHDKDYAPGIWNKWSLMEMGFAVHFYATRAQMRSNKEKAEKDLYDAGNYLELMKKKLDLVANDLAVAVEVGDLK